ncbi:hypothetical protein G9A89_006663 [Geosiphon pyriformis]|nr:hypothetical protein G9A89_006663 [Geosiphon pyriformis]
MSTRFIEPAVAHARSSPKRRRQNVKIEEPFSQLDSSPKIDETYRFRQQENMALKQPENSMQINSVVANEACRRVGAFITRDIGFDGISMQAYDVLGDIVSNYFDQLARATHTFAESGRRSKPNLNDVDKAMTEMGITTGALEGYIESFNSKCDAMCKTVNCQGNCNRASYRIFGSKLRASFLPAPTFLIPSSSQISMDENSGDLANNDQNESREEEVTDSKNEFGEYSKDKTSKIGKTKTAKTNRVDGKIKNRNDHKTSDIRPSHIPPHLPPLPSESSYKSVPMVVEVKVEEDPVTQQERKINEIRMMERNLQRLMQVDGQILYYPTTATHPPDSDGIINIPYGIPIINFEINRYKFFVANNRVPIYGPKLMRKRTAEDGDDEFTLSVPIIAPTIAWKGQKTEVQQELSNDETRIFVRAVKKVEEEEVLKRLDKGKGKEVVKEVSPVRRGLKDVEEFEDFDELDDMEFEEIED